MCNSSFQQKLLNGEITVSGEDLPGFLYDGHEVFVEENLFYGLLRSPLVLAVSRST